MPSKLQIHYEQKKLLEKQSVIEFTKQYFLVYDLQKTTPYKIFLEDIPNTNNFEIDAIQEFYSLIQSNQKLPLQTFEVLVSYDNILGSICKYEFCDRVFYNRCLSVYFKAVLMFIDQIETNLLYNSECDFLVAYKILVYYCNYNITFMKLYEEKITKNLQNKLNKSHIFFEEISGYRYEFTELCREFNSKKKTFFIENNELQRKISLSSKIINYGQKMLDFDEFLLKLNEHIKKYLMSLAPEEAYLKAMNYCSELVLRGITLNQTIIDDMKYFANKLIEI